jgi:multicomponent Na+:H+ antiporter subunit D
MNQLIFFPLVFQLLLSIVLMFAWRSVNIQKWISATGSTINLGIAAWLFSEVYNNGLLVGAAGNWAAPFGITFVADTLAATMVLLTAISGLAVSIFSAGTVLKARLKFGYYPIFHFLLLGLNGAFLTGDIFNLYVWFEIIIISSFVLITLGGEKAQLEGAVKYFTLNMLASAIFLTAIGILYGLAGSLNMADLANQIAEIENKGLISVCALLFFIGFGIKSAVFPLYFWLPASYHTPPSAVSAIFGGLLTKLGVYALIRVFSLMFVDDFFIEEMLIIIAIATMLSGAAGALIQRNIRKIFSYLIICHIGFMIAGLGMFTEVALTGAVFYLFHDIIVKTNLFMVSGLIFKIKGTNNLGKLGSLYSDFPKLSLLMAIPLFSLVGIPPLSGFWPKISLIGASLETEHYFLTATIVFASFITLFIIARMWAEGFWKEAPITNPKPNFKYFSNLGLNQKALIVVPIVILSVVSLYIGFGAENLQTLSSKIATELVDNSTYINAVLKP